VIFFFQLLLDGVETPLHSAWGAGFYLPDAGASFIPTLSKVGRGCRTDAEFSWKTPALSVGGKMTNWGYSSW
jgi:hypothetical protein